MFTKKFYDSLMTNPEHLISERKLDSALKSSDVEYTKLQLSKVGPINNNELNISILLENEERDNILTAQTSSTLWPLIMKDIMTTDLGSIKGKIKEKDRTIKIMEKVNKNMIIQRNYNAQTDLRIEKLENDGKFEKWISHITSYDPLLSKLYNIEELMTPVVERLGKLNHILKDKANRPDISGLGQLSRWRINELDLTFSWNGKVTVITYKEKKWIYPSSYILLIHNKLCDWISCHLMIKSLADVCYEKDALEKVSAFLYQLCIIATQKERCYFSVAKTLEGAIIAEIIKKEEHYKNDSLLISVCQDLSDEGFDYDMSELREIITSCSVPLMHELGGLVKIPGHPIISMDKTVDKFLKKVQGDSLTCSKALQHAANCAKENFIRNYILKHRIWPPVEFQEGCPRIFIEAHGKGIDPNNFKLVNKYGQPEIDQYVYIELGKIQELDRINHYAQHLKDKTIALTRNKVFSKFIEKAEFQKSSWKETRLLLYYLSRTDDNELLQEYFREYEKSDSDMENILDYLCIKLVPKEKELKEAARLFGCKTYQDRFRSKVQEENASKILDSYVLDQSMTLDSLGLMKRLYAFRIKNKAYKGWRALWVNFDVSSWAERWRYESTAPILSQTLDKMFDTKIFSKTHESYENGFFYIPDTTGGCYHWEGQKGGVQGLNQYTWMHTYIPMMRSLLSKFGMHFYVMAYGDDYKACFLIPPDQANLDLANFKAEVTKVVSETATIGFGHVMKSYDSYGSECFVSFCKKASVRAIELPQGVRKALKCHGSTNAFLPCIDDYISGSFSNAHGACKELPCTYGPYVLALFWAYGAIDNHFAFKDITEDQKIALSLTPSLLGGLPIIYLHNYHTRAESDYLSPFLDLTKYLLDQNINIGFEMSKFLDFEMIDVKESKETLLRDPYSLPIRKPPLPSAVLRNKFSHSIRQLVKNEEVLELMEAADEDWTDKFVKCLTSSEILQPRLLSAIYACTPKALLEEFLRRFENSSSIKEVLVMNRGIKRTRGILRQVIRADKTLQIWRAKVFTDNDPKLHWFSEVDHEWCPSFIADKLRAKWGKPVIGVSMAPSQHQIKIIEEHRGKIDSYSIRNHFLYAKCPVTTRIKFSKSDHWEISDEDPFLGHKTRLNMEIPTVRVTENNPQLLKLQNLLDLVSWTNKSFTDNAGNITESNLPSLIKLLISQYYSGDPDELTPFGGKTKGGTIGHHVRSPHYKEFIMPNQLYNMLTLWRSETNCHIFYANTPGSHFSVNFLLLRCFAIHQIMECLELSNKNTSSSRVWGVTNDCWHCKKEIIDPPIVVDFSIAPGKMRVLNFTKLDSHSRLVLEECLVEFKEKNILLLSRPSTLIPIEFACQTVMDYSVYRETKMVDSITDRFTSGIPLTDKAKKIFNNFLGNPMVALVRLSELKKLPVNSILDSLCNVISDYLSVNYSNVSRNGIITELKNRPSSSLPWAPIIRYLIQSGRIGHLMRHINMLTRTYGPAGIDNEYTIAKYIGVISLDLMDSGSLSKRCSIASYFDDNLILKKLRHMDYNCRASFINTEIREELQSECMQLRSGEEYCAVIIYICLCPPRNFVDYKDFLIRRPAQYNPVVTYSPFELDNDDDYYTVEQDSYDMYLENNFSYFPRILTYYKSRFPLAKWDMSFQEFNLILGTTYWIDRLYDDNPHHPNLISEVCITTISESILIVRGLDAQKDMDDEAIPLSIPIKKNLIPQIPPIRYEQSAMFNNITLSEHTVTNPDLQNCFDSTKVFLPEHSCSRSFGIGTSSMNKLAYVLEIYKILHIIQDISYEDTYGLKVSCLGEGYGGILSLLSSMIHDSYFLFNTIPPSDLAKTYPELARYSLSANNNKVSIELVNANVYDLTDINTMKNLEKDIVYNDIITCDAECDWTDTQNQYHNLILNVCQYYLRTRAPSNQGSNDRGGILITKLFLDAGITPYVCISLLSRYCNHVGVYRCPGSPPSSEVYVIAFGIRSPYTDNFGIVTDNILPTVTRRINSLKSVIRQYYHDRNVNLYPEMSTWRPSCRGIIPNIYQKLLSSPMEFPPIILQQLTGRLQIPITLKDLVHVGSLQEAGTIIIEKVYPIAKATYNKFKHRTVDSRRNWAADTHTSILIEAGSVIQMEGILKFTLKIMDENLDKLSEMEIQNELCDILDKMPDRLFGNEGRTYVNYNDKMWKKNGTICNIGTRFYERFVESIGWIIGFKNWTYEYLEYIENV